MTNRSLGIELDQQQVDAIARVLASFPPDISREPIAGEIRQVVLADVDERFSSAPRAESGGIVYGGEFWPRLSESYLAQNPRRQGGQILRDTGELQQSFTADGAVFETGFQEVIVGTSLPKARGLHFGVFWGIDRPELARPILFIHEQLADDIAEVVAAVIEDQA